MVYESIVSEDDEHRQGIESRFFQIGRSTTSQGYGECFVGIREIARQWQEFHFSTFDEKTLQGEKVYPGQKKGIMPEQLKP